MPSSTPALAAAVLWLLLALFLGLRALPLFEPDEGRYAATAHHMVESGDWIVPVFDGHLRLNKPPLTYWLIGAAEVLLGKGELAARLPSALASLGTAWFVYVLGRRLAGRGVASRAVVVLASCPLFVAAGRLATTDALLLCFETAAMVAATGVLAEPGETSRGRTALLLGVPLGLAVLTKGPVGLLGPALAVACGAWAAGWLRRLGRLAPLRAILIALVPAAVYYAVLYARLQGLNELPDSGALLARETWGRIAKGYAHDQPLFYYVWVIFAGAFPWHTDIPAAIARARRTPQGSGSIPPGPPSISSSTSIGSSRSIASSALRAPTAAPALAARRSLSLRRFLLGWLIALPILFSMARGKLSFYVLPVFPALAVLAAESWVARSRMALDAPARRGWGWSFLVAAAPILAAVAVGIVFSRPHEARTPIRLAIAIALVVPLAAASAWFSWRGKPEAARIAWVAAAAWLLVQLLPVARDDTRLLATSREAARDVMAHTAPGLPIIGFDTRRWPGFLYYVGSERVEVLSTFAELERVAGRASAATVLYRAEHEERVREILGDRLTPLTPTILGTEPFVVASLAAAAPPRGP